MYVINVTLSAQYHSVTVSLQLHLVRSSDRQRHHTRWRQKKLHENLPISKLQIPLGTVKPAVFGNCFLWRKGSTVFKNLRCIDCTAWYIDTLARHIWSLVRLPSQQQDTHSSKWIIWRILRRKSSLCCGTRVWKVIDVRNNTKHGRIWLSWGRLTRPRHGTEA